MSKKPTLCIDFDGVIHAYSDGWRDGEIYDRYVPGFFAWARRAMEKFDLVIYSSRSKDEDGARKMREWLGNESIRAIEEGEIEFDYDWGAFFPNIQFAHQKPPAFLTIDDRAICFDGNWSKLDPSELLRFKPWNANKGPFGATGKFPYGKLNDDDEGELTLGVAYDKLDGVVRIEFGTPVAWIGLTPPQAIEFAKALLTNAGVKKIEIEL